MSSHMKTCTDLNLYEVICLHNYLSFFCQFLDFIYSFLRGSLYSHLRFHHFVGCTVRRLIKFFQATFKKKIVRLKIYLQLTSKRVILLLTQNKFEKFIFSN